MIVFAAVERVFDAHFDGIFLVSSLGLSCRRCYRIGGSARRYPRNLQFRLVNSLYLRLARFRRAQERGTIDRYRTEPGLQTFDMRHSKRQSQPAGGEKQQTASQQ
jgi:hypothetical protein